MHTAVWQPSASAVCLQAEFCLTSESGGGIGGRLQSYAGLDGDMYLRGGGGPEATGRRHITQQCGRQSCCLRWSWLSTAVPAPEWTILMCSARVVSAISMLRACIPADLCAEPAGVLNTGQPVVRQLVMDALRWWVTEYQVDGFCFVNAENLTQVSAC